jgi:Zn-dependent protease
VSSSFEQSLIFFGCLVVAVVFHEVSHGLVASLFGDRTAAEAGRLTLNPLPHVDPFGTVIVPALGALAGLPVLAWAKPVPVNPMRMRNPRRDSLYVSLAGPATNLLLMAAGALVARALWDSTSGVRLYSGLPLGIRIAFSFAAVNLFLGLFNLLPIPPLDGSALIERVLPKEWLPGWHRFRPYGIVVLFVLVFATGFAGRILEPFLDQLFDFVFR